MRWLAIMLLMGCGGAGSPLTLGPDVQVVMHYATTAQVPCEISVTMPRTQYMDSVRPKYAWHFGADDWCGLSETDVGGQPVYASFHCDSLKTYPPWGCLPDTCAWTPP